MTGENSQQAERTVQRRKYLLGIGTALTAALAGCPASSDGGGNSTTGTTEAPPTESASPSSTAGTPADGGTATPPDGETATPTTPATEQSPTPAATPEETDEAKQLIRDFYTAADSENFQQANSLVHPDSPEGTIGENRQAVFEEQEIDIQEMTVVDEGTDRTTVRTTLVFSREGRERTRTRALELRTHDGAWRLYGID